MNNELLQLLAALRAAIAQGDTATAVTAAESLMHLGSEAVAVAPQLLPFLSNANDEIRNPLVSVLDDCGPVPASDLSLVAQSLASTDELTAYWAATLLGRGEAAATPHTAALAATLADESRPVPVREQAAWALGKIGSLDEVAKMALQHAAQSKFPRLARLAKKALTP